MANECDFTLYAEGKPEAISELLARFSNYDHSKGIAHMPHFWRIFECGYEDLEPRYAGTRLVSIYGVCAWSVQSCMTSGKFTYADQFKDDPELAPYCTSLRDTANELGLEIEVFSSEPNMGFAEHFHYTPDGLAVEEESEYRDIYWDRDEYPTFEEFDESYDYELSELGVTAEDFEEDDDLYLCDFEDLYPFFYEQGPLAA